jgi:hypothetical protein
LFLTSDDATTASVCFSDAILVLETRKRGKVVVTNEDSGDAVGARWLSKRTR